jgi:hypothetical protein
VELRASGDGTHGQARRLGAQTEAWHGHGREARAKEVAAADHALPSNTEWPAGQKPKRMRPIRVVSGFTQPANPD